MSCNVSREEGQFWRNLTRDLHVKSRGELQKFLLALGLESMNKLAAKQLAQIRGGCVTVISHGRRHIVATHRAVLRVLPIHPSKNN